MKGEVGNVSDPRRSRRGLRSMDTQVPAHTSNVAKSSKASTAHVQASGHQSQETEGSDTLEFIDQQDDYDITQQPEGIQSQ